MAIEELKTVYIYWLFLFHTNCGHRKVAFCTLLVNIYPYVRKSLTISELFVLWTILFGCKNQQFQLNFCWWWFLVCRWLKSNYWPNFLIRWFIFILTTILVGLYGATDIFSQFFQEWLLTLLIFIFTFKSDFSP